jgi:hypothetical protein
MFIVVCHDVMLSYFHLSFIWNERELARTRIPWLRASSTRLFLGEYSIPPFLAAFPCFLQYSTVRRLEQGSLSTMSSRGLYSTVQRLNLSTQGCFTSSS